MEGPNRVHNTSHVKLHYPHRMAWETRTVYMSTPTLNGRQKRCQDEAYLVRLTVQGGWRQAQLAVARDEHSYARNVRSFITTSHTTNEDSKSQRRSAYGDSLLQIGSDYGMLTQRSLGFTEAQKQFSSFQLLLWMSYIAFLEFRGCPSEEIESIVQSFSSFDQKRRRRLVPRARKINSVICNIVHVCGWSIARATEVFYLCRSSETLTSSPPY